MGATMARWHGSCAELRGGRLPSRTRRMTEGSTASDPDALFWSSRSLISGRHSAPKAWHVTLSETLTLTQKSLLEGSMACTTHLYIRSALRTESTVVPE